MNDLFKKANTKRFELDQNYFLESDGYRGLTLVFQEPRMKKKKDGSGEEEYLYTDKWYYPRISMVLQKYLELVAKDTKSVEELREVVLRVEKKIDIIRELWQ
jgi:hypothetical protein